MGKKKRKMGGGGLAQSGSCGASWTRGEKRADRLRSRLTWFAGWKTERYGFRKSYEPYDITGA